MLQPVQRDAAVGFTCRREGGSIKVGRWRWDDALISAPAGGATHDTHLPETDHIPALPHRCTLGPASCSLAQRHIGGWLTLQCLHIFGSFDSESIEILEPLANVCRSVPPSYIYQMPLLTHLAKLNSLHFSGCAHETRLHYLAHAHAVIAR